MKKSLIIFSLVGVLTSSQAIGQGFAATATPWGLPAGGYISRGRDNDVAASFYQTAMTNANGGQPGSQNWTVMDLNGDRRPDLVLPSEQGVGGMQAFGTDASRHWKVYLNTGSGFAATATPWALPAGGYVTRGRDNDVANSFYQTAMTDANGGQPGSQNWTTMDINGDNRPDLVVPGEQTAGSVQAFGTGTSRSWKVYLSRTPPAPSPPRK